MKRLLILLMFTIGLSVSGCESRSEAPEPPKCRVVTEIIIQANHVTVPGQCRYTNPRKLTAALNYLRRLELWDVAETDPTGILGARYNITLYFSDGSTKIYDQIGYAYFREANGPWKEIEPELALRLPLLLAAIPSDSI